MLHFEPECRGGETDDEEAADQGDGTQTDRRVFEAVHQMWSM